MPPLEKPPIHQSPAGRLTVGVLAGWQVYSGMPHSFLKPVLQGIYAAARDHNCNLLFACGVGQPNDIGVRLRPAWPKLSPDTDFVPVGPWNTDGLVVILPLVTPAQSRDIQEFRAEGHPVVFVGAGEPGPAVVPDNEGGIAQAVTHLVLNHGHRQIAFIAGLKDSVTDSYYRLQAFRAAMLEYGLEVDARLVAYSSHTIHGGEQAMKQLLATGLSFTAVLASNDDSCKGAIRVLQQAGRRIPKDIALIGFDDRLENMAHVPPLSSVHYPLRQAGYQSLELLLKHIAGQVESTEIVKVPTQLMVRESCGCQPDVATSAALRSFRQRIVDLESINVRPLLAQMMSEAVLAEAPYPRPSEIHALCLRLLTAFVSSLEEGTDKRFRLVVDEILRQLEGEEADAHAWQGALVVLEGGRRSLLENESPTLNQHAEKLLSRARLLISERARRRSKRYQVEQNRASDNLGWMTSRLFTARDETHILELLAEDLPKLGIQRADLVFFEPEADDPVAWSVLRSIPNPTGEVRRFLSRTFPPPDLYPAQEPFYLALVELITEENRLGFMAFDAANLDPCANVAQLFLAALKNVQLHAQVTELSLRDPMTGLRNRRYFEMALRNEVERCRRYHRDLALLMIDLDHFKDYNDTFGHLAGDEALRQVGECILATVRRGVDMVARYGGEEFVVILSETAGVGAVSVAENIRRAVESLTDLRRRLTVSSGVASASGETIQAEQLLQQADEALYTAKHLGRNQVYLSRAKEPISEVTRDS